MMDIADTAQGSSTAASGSAAAVASPPPTPPAPGPATVRGGLPPVGYTLTLPKLWLRLDLAAGPAAAVEAYWSRALAGLPAEEAAGARAVAGGYLEAAVRSACTRSGRDLYLPDPERLDGPANASCVLVSEVPMGRAAHVKPAPVVRRVLEEVPGSVAVTVHRAPGVRIESLCDPDRGTVPGTVSGTAADGAALRRIEYVLAVPGDPAGRWLSLALFAPRRGRAALVDSFDEAALSLRWTEADR